jgi:hypothetical protein
VTVIRTLMIRKMPEKIKKLARDAAGELRGGSGYINWTRAGRKG